VQYGAAPGLWIPPPNGHQDQVAMMHAPMPLPGYDMLPGNVSFPPAYAPSIITPPMHFSTPATRDVASEARASNNGKPKSPNKNGVISGALRELPAKPQLPETTPKSSGAVATLSPSSQNLNPTGIPTRAAKEKGSASVAPLPITIDKHFVPGEGHTSPLDALHENPGGTVQLLDHDALMQLQIFSTTLAVKAKQTLLQAKKTHTASEDSYQQKRAVLISLLAAARESELAHEKKVCRLMDRYHHNMKEACKLVDTDAKSAAQVLATRISEASREESYLATEDRRRIEQIRNDLHEVDNARILSTIAYADAVHGVVEASLGGQGVFAGSAATTKPEKMALEKSVSSETPHVSTFVGQDGQTSAVTAAPIDLQQGAQQPVFERQTETEHQSIDEVLGRTKHIAESDDSEEVEKNTPNYDDLLAKALAGANTGTVTPPEQQTKLSYVKVVVTPGTVKKAIELTMNGAMPEKKDSIAQPHKQQTQKGKPVATKAKEEKKANENKSKATMKKGVSQDNPDSKGPAWNEVQDIKTKSEAPAEKGAPNAKVENGPPTKKDLLEMQAVCSIITKRDTPEAKAENNVPAKTTTAEIKKTLAREAPEPEAEGKAPAVKESGTKKPNSPTSNRQVAKQGPKRKNPSHKKKAGSLGQIGDNGKGNGSMSTATLKAGPATNEVRKGG
jgi:hypothetical protein